MKRLWNAFKGNKEEDAEIEELESEYVELDALGNSEPKQDARVTVRTFNIEDFSHVKPILDSLRDGNTICLVNIKPLKDKDLVELKRAISKLKKTCEAIKGDIAGFGDDFIVVTPGFAEIYRAQPASPGAAVSTNFETY